LQEADVTELMDTKRYVYRRLKNRMQAII